MYINILYYNVLHVYVYCIMYDTYVLCIYASPQNIASLNTKAVFCRLTRAKKICSRTAGTSEHARFTRR